MLLEASGLRKTFGGITALRDFGFAVREGEILGLIGPNGAGKTVTLNVVSGVYRPDGGRVAFRGADVTGRRAAEIVRRGLARTFQSTELFREHSVLDNVVIARHCRLSTGTWHAVAWRRSVEAETARARVEARAVLEFVGLAGYTDLPAAKLPYGLQKTLGFALGLATEPTLLLLDEPTNGMNVEESARTMALIRRTRERGVAILIVEHNMRVVMGLCDRLVVLNHGEKIAEGPPDAIRRDPAVIRAYLGAEGTATHTATREAS